MGRQSPCDPPLSPREFTRVKVKMTARVSVADAPAFERAVRDIGLGGVYIETHAALRTGLTCRLEIRLDSDPDAPTIETTGRVVRSERGRGAAIEFVDMGVDAFDQLDRFVSQRSGSDAPAAPASLVSLPRSRKRRAAS